MERERSDKQREQRADHDKFMRAALTIRSNAERHFVLTDEAMGPKVLVPVDRMRKGGR